MRVALVPALIVSLAAAPAAAQETLLESAHALAEDCAGAREKPGTAGLEDLFARHEALAARVAAEVAEGDRPIFDKALDQAAGDLRERLYADIKALQDSVGLALDRPGSANLLTLTGPYKTLKARVEASVPARARPPYDAELATLAEMLAKLEKDFIAANAIPFSDAARRTRRPEGEAADPAQAARDRATLELDRALLAWKNDARPKNDAFAGFDRALAGVENAGAADFSAARDALLATLSADARAALAEHGLKAGDYKSFIEADMALTRALAEAYRKQSGKAPESAEDLSELQAAIAGSRPALARYMTRRGQYQDFLARGLGRGLVAAGSRLQPWELDRVLEEWVSVATRTVEGKVVTGLLSVPVDTTTLKSDGSTLFVAYLDGRVYEEVRAKDGSLVKSLARYDERGELTASLEEIFDGKDRRLARTEWDASRKFYSHEEYDAKGEKTYSLTRDEVNDFVQEWRSTIPSDAGPEERWLSRKYELSTRRVLQATFYDAVNSLYTVDGATTTVYATDGSWSRTSLVDGVTTYQRSQPGRTPEALYEFELRDLGAALGGAGWEKQRDAALAIARKAADKLERDGAAEAIAGWLIGELPKTWDPSGPPSFTISDGVLRLTYKDESGEEVVKAARLGKSEARFGLEASGDAVLTYKPYRESAKNSWDDKVQYEYRGVGRRFEWKFSDYYESVKTWYSWATETVGVNTRPVVQVFTVKLVDQKWKHPDADSSSYWDWSDEEEREISRSQDTVASWGKSMGEAISGVPGMAWADEAGRKAFHWTINNVPITRVYSAWFADEKVVLFANEAMYAVPSDAKDPGRPAAARELLARLEKDHLAWTRVEQKAKEMRAERAKKLGRSFADEEKLSDEELLAALKTFASSEFGHALVDKGEKSSGFARAGFIALGTATQFTLDAGEGMFNPIMIATMGLGPAATAAKGLVRCAAWLGRAGATVARAGAAGGSSLRAAKLAYGAKMLGHMGFGSMIATGGATHLLEASDAATIGDWRAFWESGVGLASDAMFAAVWARTLPKRGWKSEVASKLRREHGKPAEDAAKALERTTLELGPELTVQLPTAGGKANFARWPKSLVVEGKTTPLTVQDAAALAKMPRSLPESALSGMTPRQRALYELKKSLSETPGEFRIGVKTSDAAKLDALRERLFKEHGVLAEFVDFAPPASVFPPEVISKMKILQSVGGLTSQLIAASGKKGPPGAGSPKFPLNAEVANAVKRGEPGSATHMRVYEFVRDGGTVKIKVTEIAKTPPLSKRLIYEGRVPAEVSPLLPNPGESLRHVMSVAKDGPKRTASPRAREEAREAVERGTKAEGEAAERSASGRKRLPEEFTREPVTLPGEYLSKLAAEGKYSPEIMAQARAKGDVFELTPDNLHRVAGEGGVTYNYAIVLNGDGTASVVVGRYRAANKGQEVGVKHAAIAEGRPVLRSGEIRYDPKTDRLHANLNSGTFAERTSSYAELSPWKISPKNAASLADMLAILLGKEVEVTGFRGREIPGQAPLRTAKPAPPDARTPARHRALLRELKRLSLEERLPALERAKAAALGEEAAAHALYQRARKNLVESRRELAAAERELARTEALRRAAVTKEHPMYDKQIRELAAEIESRRAGIRAAEAELAAGLPRGVVLKQSELEKLRALLKETESTLREGREALAPAERAALEATAAKTRAAIDALKSEIRRDLRAHRDRLLDGATARDPRLSRAKDARAKPESGPRRNAPRRGKGILDRVWESARPGVKPFDAPGREPLQTAGAERPSWLAPSYPDEEEGSSSEDAGGERAPEGPAPRDQGEWEGHGRYGDDDRDGGTDAEESAAGPDAPAPRGDKDDDRAPLPADGVAFDGGRRVRLSGSGGSSSADGGAGGAAPAEESSAPEPAHDAEPVETRYASKTPAPSTPEGGKSVASRPFDLSARGPAAGSPASARGALRGAPAAPAASGGASAPSAMRGATAGGDGAWTPASLRPKAYARAEVAAERSLAAKAAPRVLAAVVEERAAAAAPAYYRHRPREARLGARWEMTAPPAPDRGRRDALVAAARLAALAGAVYLLFFSQLPYLLGLRRRPPAAPTMGGDD